MRGLSVHGNDLIPAVSPLTLPPSAGPSLSRKGRGNYAIAVFSSARLCSTVLPAVSTTASALL